MVPPEQSLAEQEAHLRPQIKELEANVLAAAPDKTVQKQMEKGLQAFTKGGSSRRPRASLTSPLTTSVTQWSNLKWTDLLVSPFQTLRRRPARRGRWRRR